jgi:CheY-like chemotaxis protein
MESNDAGSKDATRFGGAAADFIASLGRKAAELRPALDALALDPAHRAREDLRRKLHALGVGARLLHFEVLAQAISNATRRLDEASSAGRVSRGLVAELQMLADRLPELAFQRGATLAPAPTTEARSEAVVPVASVAAPWTVLLIGPEALALALEDDPQTFPCEIERTSDLATALDLARAVAPDLLVVDVEQPGGLELVAAFADDALTGPVPIVAVAERLGATEKLSRLMALGVAKALEKPVAGVTLREACAELVGERSRAVPTALHPELGEVTVAELAARLEDELRRLLLGQLAPTALERKVSLGTGAEVLGPFWGALARIRDVLRDKSQGGVSFRDDGLRRPVAIAPMGEAIVERKPGRRAAPEVDLEGRTVIVADDDPAIAEYVAGALCAAGATVHTAGEGGSALALARRHDPAALVSDVLMPGLDGVGLARALRRDVALRDRPMILLSWKEDLLQRLRDLRVDSSATLRKNDDAATIVARVREVLAARVRVEARIAGGAEVRGRLDDLTVSSLLSIANGVRKEACVVVRDAAHLFEVELAGGGIRRLSRTSVDGTLVRGLEALPSLLGVIGGRFLIRPMPARTEGEPLVGELEEQLQPVLRALRAACEAVGNPLELAALGLSPAGLAGYLGSTPPPVRRLLERLSEGASPRTMILAGDVTAAAMEDVLLDAAARGLVVRATSVKGLDLLTLEAERLDEPARPMPAVAPPREPEVVAPPEVAVAHFDFSLDSFPPPTPTAPDEPHTEVDAPGSLADAVLAVASPGSSTSKPAILDARQLRPRVGNHRSDPPPSLGERFSAMPTPRAPHAVARASEPRVETLHGIVPDASVGDDTLPPPLRAPKNSPTDR